MPISMGLGELSNSSIIFKRKFRWTFEITNICGALNIPQSFVKLASRPNLNVDEIEVPFLGARLNVPGRGLWDNISVTYYDLSGKEAVALSNLYTWIDRLHNFITSSGPTEEYKQSSKISEYSATGILTLYDGCGSELEKWQFNKIWPVSANFGELDYADSNEVNIELTLRFFSVEYTNLCKLLPTEPPIEGPMVNINSPFFFGRSGNPRLGTGCCRF